MRKQKGVSLPLTIHVVPGQIFEGLIKQDDRQRHLKHHSPLPTTQWGHLENELVGGREDRLQAASCVVTHLDSSALFMGLSLEALPSYLCLQGFPEEAIPLPTQSFPDFHSGPGGPLSKRAPPFLYPEGGNIRGMMARHICPYCRYCPRPKKARHSVGTSSIRGLLGDGDPRN